MTKIIIEHEKCIGCGSCAAVCSKYFEMADDGKSKLKGSTLNSVGNYELETDKIECAETAAESCPVQCIQINK
jgi:ferredoxin